MPINLKLYKLPIHLTDVDRFLPIDNDIDEVLKEFPVVKEFTNEEDVYIRKVGTQDAVLKLPNEEDFLDFNYVVVEWENLIYFKRTKNYFFVSSYEKNLVHNTDKAEHALVMDVVAMYGSEFLNELDDQYVNIERNHANRWENSKPEIIETFYTPVPIVNAEDGTGASPNLPTTKDKNYYSLDVLGKYYGKRTFDIDYFQRYISNLIPEANLPSVLPTPTRSNEVFYEKHVRILHIPLINNDHIFTQKHMESELVRQGYDLDLYTFVSGYTYKNDNAEYRSFNVGHQWTKNEYNAIEVYIKINIYKPLYSFQLELKGNKEIIPSDEITNFSNKLLEKITADVHSTFIANHNIFIIGKEVSPIDLEYTYSDFVRREDISLKQNANGNYLYDNVNKILYIETIATIKKVGKKTKYIPSQDRESIVWGNSEINVDANLINHKTSKNIDLYPDVHEFVDDGNAFLYDAFPSISKEENEALVIATHVLNNRIREIASTQRNYFMYAVVPSSIMASIDSNGKVIKQHLEQPFLYIPVNDGNTARTMPDIVKNSQYCVNSKRLYDSMLSANSFEYLVSEFGNNISNIIITTTPLINFDKVETNGRIDIEKTFLRKWKKPSISFNGKEVQKASIHNFFALRNPTKARSNMVQVSLVEAIKILEGDKLPIEIYDDEYLEKNVEVALLNPTYTKYELQDLLQAENKPLNNFDIITGQKLGITEQFTNNGPKYTMKIKNALDYLSYENDVVLPFGVHTMAEFIRTNNERLSSRKNAIDTQENLGIGGTATNTVLSIFGAGVGGLRGKGGLGGAFAAIQGGQSLGSGVVSGLQGRTAANQARVDLQAEISTAANQVHQVKDPIKNITDLNSPLQGDIKNGEYGFNVKPHALINYYLPKFMKQKIAKLFNDFGYTEKRVEKLNDEIIRSRYLFNYIELGQVKEHLNDSSIPAPILANLERIFRSGIRIHHCRKDIATHYPNMKRGTINKNLANYETFLVENGYVKK